MTVQVHWGVQVPMVCQLCRHPVESWQAEVVLTQGPRTCWCCPGPQVPETLAVVALCHGATEARVYHLDGIWVEGLRPTHAFPLPDPWPEPRRSEAESLAIIMELLADRGIPAAELVGIPPHPPHTHISPRRSPPR